MSARRKDKDSFEKKLVIKLLELKNKNYEEWLEENIESF